MRIYTNSENKKIVVSEEHLKVAVKLKKELQKMSPSRKCNWSLHKKLMQKENFLDSDKNENYRQLIKSYQSSIGELPAITNYANLVSDNKLNSIKELVGEISYEKREIQHYLKEINQGKRELIDFSLLAEEIKFSVENLLNKIGSKNFTLIKRIETKKSNNRLIVLATDFHIGALVNIEGNKYNFEVANKRVSEFIEQIYKTALENNISIIDVVFMGDAIEHAYMRNSQSYNAEFPLSEQISKCAELLLEILIKLSNDFIVSYRGFGGNHDRINQFKEDNIYGDNVVVVINKIIETFIKASNNQNIKYHNCEPYSAKLLDVNGVNLKFIHGDLEKRQDNSKIHKHSSNDGIIYNAIVMGHFHHYECVEVGIDKFEIKIGSLKGSDDYTEKLGIGSLPSQGVIIVDEKGNMEIKRIRLFN